MPEINYSREDSVGFLTHVVANQFALALVKQFQQQEIDITHDMWLVLNILWDEDGLPQQAIADKLHKDKSSLTRLLHTMEEKGYLSRKAVGSDKRKKQIVLTSEGRDLQKTLRRCALDVLRQASKGIGVREWVSCLDTLRHMVDNLG